MAKIKFQAGLPISLRLVALLDLLFSIFLLWIYFVIQWRDILILLASEERYSNDLWREIKWKSLSYVSCFVAWFTSYDSWILNVFCDKLVSGLSMDTPSSYGLDVVLRTGALFHICCPFFGRVVSCLTN